MKKLLLTAGTVLCLLACTEDLSSYYDRLDKREEANRRLEEENAKQEASNAEQEAWNAEQQRRNDEQAAENAAAQQRNSDLSDQADELGKQNDDLQQQTDDQSQQNDDLAQQNDDLEQRNEQLRLMWEELQQRLDSLESLLGASQNPHLESMEFVTMDNAKLKTNVKCEIVGDSVIECWIPEIMTDKKLIPRFTFEGTLVVIDGFEAESGKTRIDFNRPRTVAVTTLEKKTYYTIYVHSYTGLPLLYLTTNGNRKINSKDVYIAGTYKLIEDVRTRAAGDVLTGTMNIKGRGNSTWHRPKKPYRLKLDDKQPFLGMHKDRHWVLIANYPDKTMLRNHLTNYMGHLSNLDYTPESHFVEVFLNTQYQGTYQLCEKLRVSDHRVAVGDDGFLLEVDHRAPDETDYYFDIPHLEKAVNIKAPDGVRNDANYNYIKDYMTKADAALFSSNFTDVNSGWQRYLDMDSFVEWYVINEISKNLDSKFYTSCYMNLKRGGKLKMGPLWDYDVAYGNIAQETPADAVLCRSATGFYIKNAKWFTRLFQDPAFVAKVKERYKFFYRHKSDILQNINADAQYLRYSAVENDKKWNILYEYQWSNYNIWGCYQNEVQSLKVWLNERMDWLKAEFDKM